MSLFTELKRRNVFRVAAAYVVTAWLLIEVGNTLEETLHLPEWTDTLLAFFLIIGFLPVLFFTWAYEITPEGIRREKDIEVPEAARSATRRKLDRLIVVVMALALVYFAADKWLLSEAPRPGQEVTATGPAESPVQAAPAKAVGKADNAGDDGDTVRAEESLAVLPFANMSADPENEYFSDGISEELLNLLVDIEGLRVPSRTSSFAFKGMNTDIRDIARQLNVGHILEGSVRKAGNRVRITAQLIDVSTDTHLWSETYDRELEDIFAIQDEIAHSIVKELQVVLGTALPERKPTEDLEAYSLFLQGRYLFQQRGGPNLLQAEALLMQAVDLDPEFAEAWGVLALTRAVAPAYLGKPSKSSRPQVLMAAERALSLDPGLAEPRLAMAQASNDWLRPLELFEETVRNHPRYALARLWYAIHLMKAGYLGQALEQFRESVRLDPIAGVNLDWLARALIFDGQYEEGVALARKAIALGRRQAALAIQIAAIVTGKTALMDESVRESAPFGPDYFPLLLELRNDPEKKEAALAWLEKRTRMASPDSAFLSRYAHLAIEWSARDAEATFAAILDIMEFDDSIIHTLWRPDGAWFRQHPLMKRLATEFGLVELWRERGYPDLCRPENGEEFVCD